MILYKLLFLFSSAILIFGQSDHYGMRKEVNYPIRIGYDDEVIRYAQSKDPDKVHAKNLQEFFANCNTQNKVCKGLFNEDCVEKKNCVLAASVTENATHFEIDLLNRAGPKPSSNSPNDIFVAIGFPPNHDLRIPGQIDCRNPRIEDFKFIIFWNRDNIQKATSLFGYYTYSSVAKKEYWKYMCLNELLDEEEKKTLNQRVPEYKFVFKTYLKDKAKNFFSIGGLEKSSNGSAQLASFLDQAADNVKVLDNNFYTNIEPVRRGTSDYSKNAIEEYLQGGENSSGGVNLFSFSLISILTLTILSLIN